MDYLEAKRTLVERYGAMPSVAGIGVLGRDRLGVYLWDDVDFEPVELEGFEVEIVRPGHEPLVDEPAPRRQRRRAPDPDDIPF